MLETILYIAIGTFVGWNLPQPFWARTIQAKVLGFLTQVEAPKKSDTDET